MKRGIMIFHLGEWVIWIGQLGYPVYPGAPFELRIQNHYHQVVLFQEEMDWFIELEGTSFKLRWAEIYKVRINIEDYKPYVTPL